jgi:Protein of unknown function (DUF3300)
MNSPKLCLAVCVSASILWTTFPASPEAVGMRVPGGAGQEVYAPVPPNDMDALVAPIALYPDALVAQILGAATYPDQVEAADAFAKSNYNLLGQALVQAAEDQDWDPSVMALLQFPSVLDEMAQNIGWTSALGDVSANQQSDVMAAIQRMRAKAYAAGNLKTGQQIKVVKESPDVIVIQPANPQVVYVPAYNPTVVYGAPVAVPGYSAGTLAATSVMSFGMGVAVGAMISNSSCGWGYYGWRMNWHGGMVYCGGARYYGNPYWWGGYYPGFRPGYHPPYYPPPRPPMRPPVGWRPPPPGSRPPYRPPSGRPPGVYPPPGGGKPSRPPTGGKPPGGKPPVTIQPVPQPQPSRPGGPGGRPTIQPAPMPRPTTRPAGPETTRALRGYPPSAQNRQAASPPNAFSGSTGGRPESARGNRSLNPPKTPSAPPKASAPARTPTRGRTP